MLDKEIMEWGCKFADELEWIEVEIFSKHHAMCVNGLVYTIKDFEDEFKKNIYPLFLQRVIEGINSSRDVGDWLILTPTNSSLTCINNSDQNKVKSFYFDRDKHIIDKAKEQAIEYIYKELNK